MDFINDSNWEALHYESLDPWGETWEVVITKAGYAMGPGGRLELLPEAFPLADDDEPWDPKEEGGLRWEGDLAPYKPLCDVLINAVAWAPGRPSRSFRAAVELWRPRPGTGSYDLAMNKQLRILGPRVLRKKRLPLRFFWGLVRLASLGLLRRNPWKLQRARKVDRVAVRWQSAWGGFRKLMSLDPEARRVRRRHRLPGVDLRSLRAAALAGEPDQAIAAASHPANHLGLGFAPRWYLKATRLKRLPAPQVEYAEHPLSARGFWRQARGKAVPDLAPAGLGVVDRCWHPRVQRAGNPCLPESFGEDEYPGLPEDFDYRYWNCAPDDQQVPYLQGGEVLVLTNLCAPGHPASFQKEGDTLLRIELPRDRPYLVVKDAQGRFGARTLNLDTVIVEPEEGRVLLTWRAALRKGLDLQWAVLDLQKDGEEDKLGPLLAWMERSEAHG